MPIQLNGKPLAGFDQPLEMLCDCHRRVEHFLDVQLRVAEKYRGGVLDQDGRKLLENALAYFAESAPKHTADEEESLFPRLRRVDHLSNECLQSMQRLEEDHQQANDWHTSIDEILHQWLSSDTPLPLATADQLLQQLTALREHYRDHIRIEEQVVFPYAGQTLLPSQLLALGHEMRHRRHLE